MTDDLLVDPITLREEVRDKYRDVALDPHTEHHFHTGRPLAVRLGYDQAVVDAFPDRTVESFAGVGNPFSLRRLVPGERVVDVGTGAGFDSFIAAGLVGTAGEVVGIDMTPEMLAKSRRNAGELGVGHVSFCDGLAEAIPIDDAWADAVISNGVVNLCADKRAAFAEIHRILRPAACCNSPTSPTAAPSRWRRCATSTFGPAELPVGCPVRAGRRCSKTPDWSTSRSDLPSTPSAAPRARRTPAPSMLTATPSSPESHDGT